jgi:hypothetical protein
MSVNFCPDRERMFKEVEQCIILDRLENLISFCNSCSLKDFNGRPVPECRECKIQRGIKTVSKKKKGFERGPDGERLRNMVKVIQRAKFIIGGVTRGVFQKEKSG